jgi:hypothetical protein
VSPPFGKGRKLDQPGGREYSPRPSGSGDDALIGQFMELCERVEDPAERARLLGVPPNVEAAWREGRALPILRARRKALEDVLRRM